MKVEIGCWIKGIAENKRGVLIVEEREDSEADLFLVLAADRTLSTDSTGREILQEVNLEREGFLRISKVLGK